MIRVLSLIFLGAASFAAVYALVPARQPSTEAPTNSQPLAVAADAKPAAPTPDTPADVVFELRPGAEPLPLKSEPAHAVRDVTPNNMTAAPRVTGTLARVTRAPIPAGARTDLLFNPIVIAAGTIKVRDREIHLAGIAAPEFEKMCGSGATAWPCGRLARAALRSFIHSRAIDCEIPAGSDKIPDPATCFAGSDNLSEWLVAQGWAKRSGNDFADGEKKARQAKLGLWGDRRPDSQVASGTN